MVRAWVLRSEFYCIEGTFLGELVLSFWRMFKGFEMFFCIKSCCLNRETKKRQLFDTIRKKWNTFKSKQNGSSIKLFFLADLGILCRMVRPNPFHRMPTNHRSFLGNYDPQVKNSKIMEYNLSHPEWYKNNQIFYQIFSILKNSLMWGTRSTLS